MSHQTPTRVLSHSDGTTVIRITNSVDTVFYSLAGCGPTHRRYTSEEPESQQCRVNSSQILVSEGSPKAVLASKSAVYQGASIFPPLTSVLKKKIFFFCL